MAPERQAAGFGRWSRIAGTLALIGSLACAAIVLPRPPVSTLSHATAAARDYAAAVWAPAPAVAAPAPSGTAIRVGGTVKRIDSARGTLLIASSTLQSLFTIEVTASTVMTSSKWAAGIGDLEPGDQLTVSGLADPAHARLGPQPITAQRIRVNSPRFAGSIVAIARAGSGAAILSVQTSHGHVLRIDAPPGLAVIDGTRPARLRDLALGTQISAQGRRTGKFELVASSIIIHLHHYTIGGTVIAVAPGSIHLLNARGGKRVTVQVTAYTRYTVGGAPIAAGLVHAGMHIRVHGFDALQPDRNGLPVMVADHVTLLVHQRLLGGTVTDVQPGIYRLVNTYYGSRYSVHVSPRTQFRLGSKPVAAVRVLVGMHVRVYGYDAQHNDQRGVLTVIANRVDVIATPIRPHHRTITGTVVALGPGMVHLSSTFTSSRFALQLTPSTIYAVGKKAVPASTLQAGMNIRAVVHDPLTALAASARLDRGRRPHQFAGA